MYDEIHHRRHEERHLPDVLADPGIVPERRFMLTNAYIRLGQLQWQNQQH